MSRAIPLTVAWLTIILSLHLQAAEKSLSELEVEAKKILADPDNISRRKSITPVFELAEKYATQGETNLAINCYLRALEHQPWNLQAQLALGILFRGIGDTNKCRQKCELVWTNAESDDLVSEAAKLLGQPFTNRFPETAEEPPDKCSLTLVPFAGTDAWLLQALREELSRILKIPVAIRPYPLESLRPEHDPLHLRARELRGMIIKSQNTEEIQALQKKLKLSIKSMTNDDMIIDFTEKLLESSPNKDQASRFRDEVAFLRRQGPQWDATQLVGQLGKATKARPGSSAAYLGVTTLDLFANDSRYVFGLAANNGNCGVFSYRRYTAALWDARPNQQLLKERAVKQALSSTGLMFGLPRCADPTCARAYANSLDEHDAKQLRLCDQCQTGFQRRFGKKPD